MFISQSSSPDVHKKEVYMGEGRWGKFYFCIFLSKRTPFNSVYIFIFILCTVKQLRLVQRFVNGSLMVQQQFVYSWLMDL